AVRAFAGVGELSNADAVPTRRRGGFRENRPARRCQHQRPHPTSRLWTNGRLASTRVSIVFAKRRCEWLMGGGRGRSNPRICMELGLRRLVVSRAAFRVARSSGPRDWQRIAETDI